MLSTRLNYAELKGKGEKLEDFARTFVNEMVAHDIKCKQVPSNSENEIYLKVRSNPFLIGFFHAISEKGNLYYRAKLRNNKILFFGIMGIIFLIGLVVGFNTGEAGQFFVVAFPVWWLFIGGAFVLFVNKSKKELFPFAVKSAEAEFR